MVTNATAGVVTRLSRDELDEIVGRLDEAAGERAAKRASKRDHL